jgi:hypothetical protein
MTPRPPRISVVVHRLGELACPVALAAADKSLTLQAPSRTNLQSYEQIATALGPRLASPLAVAPCGHNIPMELPEWAAAFVGRALTESLKAELAPS